MPDIILVPVAESQLDLLIVTSYLGRPEDLVWALGHHTHRPHCVSTQGRVKGTLGPGWYPSHAPDPGRSRQ